MIHTILACATCASNFRDETTNAASWSIFAMLVIITLMLGGVGFFMARLARRSEQSLDPEFRDELPPASSSR